MHTSGTQVSKQSTFYNKSFGLETETRDAIIIIIFSISNPRAISISYISVSEPPMFEIILPTPIISCESLGVGTIFLEIKYLEAEI